MDEDAARVLAGLTRSDVVILASNPWRATATTLDAARTVVVAQTVGSAGDLHGTTREIGADGQRLLLAWAPLGTSAAVAFVRVEEDELSVLPSLTRLAIIFGSVSLLGALLLGIWLTTQVTKPVRRLSEAAHAFAAGATDVPLPPSRFDDIAIVSQAFADMRRALAARLAELREANRSLADQSARLAALQSDLMQRERVDAVNRMVVQLAHEVRNPVASLRNLLELIRRRAADDEQTAVYADLAIDELLRMHELAERMLDINRRSARDAGPTDPHRIASDIARLATPSGPPEIVVTGEPGALAEIDRDAMKQVLLNLVQNAREAMLGATPPVAHGRIAIDVQRNDGRVTVTVHDNGPGIDPEILPRVFDPFVTTKQQVHGVGLGLYVAESAVRAAGGSIHARNERSGGATFVIELPAVRTRQA
jgi:signal transduction histidine kinase